MRVIFLLLLLLSMACQNAETRKPKQYRLAIDWVANPNYVPLFVGQELGFFKDEGIPLEIFKSSKDDPLQHIIAGQAEFAITYLPRLIRRAAKGFDLYVCGKVIEKPLNGFLILSDSGMKSLQDFNGRVLGYDAAHCTNSLLQALLDAKNIQCGCVLNSGTHAPSDLAHKKVDILYGALADVDPYEIEAKGLKSRFIPVSEFGMPDYEEFIIVAAGRFRTLALTSVNFENALQKSIDYCRENPDQAFEIYKRANPEKSAKTLLWEEKSWQAALPLLAHSQEFSRRGVNTLKVWLEVNELINKPVNIESHFHLLTN